MAVVKIADELWYEHEAAAVLECLLAWVPHEGMDAAAVQAKLGTCGFGHTLAEFAEIRDRLVAAGSIVIE